MGHFLKPRHYRSTAGISFPDDWTWQDLRELGKAGTSGEGMDKVYGIRIPIFDKTVWAVAMSWGADLFNAERTQGNFEDPIVLEAAQFLWDLRWKDGSMPTPGDEQAIGLVENSSSPLDALACTWALVTSRPDWTLP